MSDVVAENSTDLDPNLRDYEGKAALHYALERGGLEFVRILVERMGADWDLRVENESATVSNETLAKPHPECIEYLQKCKEKYSIKPNVKGNGEICVICLEKIETDAYAMECCAVTLHTGCLRNYLVRSDAFRCLMCRKKISKKNEALYNTVPNTIFKDIWKKKRRMDRFMLYIYVTGAILNAVVLLNL